MNSRRIPLATYRLQFNRRFTFEHASGMVDYLRELGISDCYASPLFKAGPQSTHGYDICGFDQFSPNLGESADFDRFSARLRELELGLLLDMVPNHMGADLSNTWWLDVLEKGQASPYASWFDIDWQPLKSDLHDQVLLPVLEDHYATVLEAGKLKICFENGGFAVAYYERKFPLAPRSYPTVLEQVLALCPDGARATDAVISLSAMLSNLKSREATAPVERAEFDQIKRQLLKWYQSSESVTKAMETALQRLNGNPGKPRSFDQLHKLLQEQHYRLAYWRVGPEEINYRRFFDVTDLVSLRMELPEVFQSTHDLIARLVQQGKITGLRIDHPDGLWDPKQYFERLQSILNGTQPEGKPSQKPLYVVAEKILTGDEPLPSDWPVDGTTGYDFLNRLNGVFINHQHERLFQELYQEFSGAQCDFRSLVYTSKRHILQLSLISELNALAHRLKGIAIRTRYGLDFTFRQLHEALGELIAAFPVYRTYITEDTQEVSPVDRRHISEAIHAVKHRKPALDSNVIGFIESLLLLETPPDLEDTDRKRCREFVMRFQQLTGPVMAKGLEDTAFYNFNRFVSLNEVGGEPDKFGTDLQGFHAYNQFKAQHWPHALLATATHDTKRGEDVRARLNTLSEIPEVWREIVFRWGQMNRDKKTVIDGQPAPHPNDEYLLYQTLVGAWTAEAEAREGLATFKERVNAYMLKAIKEAKTRTNWTNSNAEYERALLGFVNALLADSSPNPFLEDLKRFQPKIAYFGWLNSLSQTLLKLTSPGVPDFYQGTELWDFSLVDPDNRRPVDYSLRKQMLSDLKAQFHPEPARLRPLLAQMVNEAQTGRIKLYVIWQALEFRRRHRLVLDGGQYLPLFAIGPKQDHVCAFAKVLKRQACITIAPRLVVGLTNAVERLPCGPEVWEGTRLPLPTLEPGAKYRNAFTHEILSPGNGTEGLNLAEALSVFPVALLEPV
ncbi:MAG TPA: malto-oligosyltrehalose synthase [Clostridia bacterium]|nr:malto-oligosyltrehalose synthase [Clostridia bacterium]